MKQNIVVQPISHDADIQLDEQRGEVLGQVPVGVEPEGMRVSADSRVTVVTSESTSVAHFIDNMSLKVIANVLVDTRPGMRNGQMAGPRRGFPRRFGGTVAVMTRRTTRSFGRLIFRSPEYAGNS